MLKNNANLRLVFKMQILKEFNGRVRDKMGRRQEAIEYNIDNGLIQESQGNEGEHGEYDWNDKVEIKMEEDFGNSDFESGKSDAIDIESFRGSSVSSNGVSQSSESMSMSMNTKKRPSVQSKNSRKLGLLGSKSRKLKRSRGNNLRLEMSTI